MKIYLLKFIFKLFICGIIVSSCTTIKPGPEQYRLVLKEHQLVNDPETKSKKNYFSLTSDAKREFMEIYDELCECDCMKYYIFTLSSGHELVVEHYKIERLIDLSDPINPNKIIKEKFINDCESTEFQANCRDNSDWLTGFYVGSGYRNVTKEDTYTFFDEEGVIISENVPEKFPILIDAFYTRGISNDNKWQFGVATGFWQIENSNIIPIGLHLRWLAYPEYKFISTYGSSEKQNCCSKTQRFINYTGFISLGVPISLDVEKLFINKFSENYSMFADIGGGLGLNFCKFDLMLEGGFRYNNISIGEIECCPELPDSQRYIFRKSFYPFVRLGLIF